MFAEDSLCFHIKIIHSTPCCVDTQVVEGLFMIIYSEFSLYNVRN